MREIITEQAYRISLVKYLSKYISNDECDMLLIGSDDPEIFASFSPYDKLNATSKARHVADALRELLTGTLNSIAPQVSISAAHKKVDNHTSHNHHLRKMNHLWFN